MKTIFIFSKNSRIVCLYTSAFFFLILLIGFQMISISSNAQQAIWIESLNNKLRSINVSSPPVQAGNATALASPTIPLFIFQDQRNGWIYFSEAGTGTIRRVGTSGGAVTTVVNGISGSGKYPRGIYVDVTNNILYWSQSAPGLNDEIKKISIAGTLPKSASLSTTVVSAINIVRGITVDTISNSIYFVEAGLGGSGKGIYRASLTSPTNGASSTKIAANSNSAQPNALFLDRANNFIYWSDYSINGGIKRAATNSAVYPVIETPIISGVSARGLYVDPSNVLYWTEFPSQKIKKANLANINIPSTTNVVNGVVGFARNISISSPCISAGFSSITANNNSLCPGTSATITVNGIQGTNASITWYSGPGATGNNLGNGNVLPNVTAGTYYAYITADCGLPSEGSITITNDNIAPTIVCPSNRQESNSQTCSIPISISNPTFSDNCSIQSLTYTVTGATTLTSPTTGIRYVGTKTFALGTSTVIYKVTDNSNNTTTCSFNVTVKDGLNPYFITSNTNMEDSVTSGCSKTITIPDVTFADNCGTPQLTWSMTGSTVASGTGQIGSATFNVGITTVTYTLTDGSGNIGTSTFLVLISDKIPPTITCRSNIVTNTLGSDCFRNIGITLPAFGDNCKIRSLTWALNGATVLSSPLTGINNLGVKSYNIGLTTVSFTATDSSGNSTTCSFTVQVNSTNSCFAKMLAKESSLSSTDLKARLTPNPTTLSFNLFVKSSVNELVDVVVYNNEGQKIEQLKASPNQSILFGEKYAKGAYLIEAKQGDKRSTIVGVKQ